MPKAFTSLLPWLWNYHLYWLFVQEEELRRFQPIDELHFSTQGGHGVLERRPEDSVYYHPTLNPTGEFCTRHNRAGHLLHCLLVAPQLKKYTPLLVLSGVRSPIRARGVCQGSLKYGLLLRYFGTNPLCCLQFIFRIKRSVFTIWMLVSVSSLALLCCRI